MNYEVVLLRNAQAEFNDIVDRLAARSQTGIMNWLDAYERIIDRLERNPESFGVAPENYAVALTIRQALFRTRKGKVYRLLYTIVGNTVRVLHLRSPGQAAAPIDI